MTTLTDTKTAAPANLRASRKEQAAAKKAPAKAPAKKAAPKPAAKKAPAKAAAPAATKLSWKIDGPVEPKGKPQSATAGDREYKITGSGTSWKAVVKQGRKTTVLSEGKSFGVAYGVCVKHNAAAQPAKQSAA